MFNTFVNVCKIPAYFVKRTKIGRKIYAICEKTHPPGLKPYVKR